MATSSENRTIRDLLNMPISGITIGVINTRKFGYRVPFIEQHAFIAETPQGYITVHYERNQEYPIITPLNHRQLNKWEHGEFQTPRDGITVRDLYRDIGEFWIFPDFRYVDEILPNLFSQQSVISVMNDEWKRISLTKSVSEVVKLKVTRNIEAISNLTKLIKRKVEEFMSRFGL